jgi:hypothetical protein
LLVEYDSRLRQENPAARSAALTELRGYAQSELPQRIVSDWQNEVDEHYNANPFTNEELGQLTQHEQAAVKSEVRIAYGSTLAAVLLLTEHAVYLQLGDGDILVVGDAGGAPLRPLPPDDRSFANETASLCLPGPASTRRLPGGQPPGPWADFRVRVVVIGPDPPALVLITTDGYVNAFVNDAAFRKVATDLLAMGREEGWDYVKEHLPTWLQDASRSGSGDDVTVAIVVRHDGPDTDTQTLIEPPIAGSGEPPDLLQDQAHPSDVNPASHGDPSDLPGSTAPKEDP